MRVNRRWTLFAISVLLIGCAAEEGPTATEDLLSQARRLVQESIIVDTHVDTPSRLLGSEEDLSVLGEKGNFDHPRAVEGGLNAPFMAIYVPASLQEESHSPDTGGLLEYPHYTRPVEFRGMGVPEVLQSGHHKNIADWRREQAEARTVTRRPDIAARSDEAKEPS